MTGLVYFGIISLIGLLIIAFVLVYDKIKLVNKTKDEELAIKKIREDLLLDEKSFLPIHVGSRTLNNYNKPIREVRVSYKYLCNSGKIKNGTRMLFVYNNNNIDTSSRDVSYFDDWWRFKIKKLS